MIDWRQHLERLGALGLAGAAILVAFSVASLVPDRPDIALGLAGMVLVGVLALVSPVTLPLLAMPVVVVVERIGGGGFDLTVSDAMLVLAFWPAVLLGPRPFSPELRVLLWGNAAYQALTIFTLISNPFLANTVEWFHAWLLVSGALVVGWAVGAAGHARLGLSLFLLACIFLAIPTVVQGVAQVAAGNFGAVYPQWPWPMHKNFVGNLLTMAALVAYARPSWMGWSKRSAFSVFTLFAVGIALAQSRQALLGLAVGLLIIALRRHGGHRRIFLALAIVVPMGYFVVTLVREQIASGDQHNSWFQRIDWYREAFAIWMESPLVGHGLRYWTQPGAVGAFQPPNAFLEVLASAGFLGLLGFIVLWGSVILVLRRVDPLYGTLALALGVSRLTQSQMDLFWVSISVSVPFLLIGVCLGQAHRSQVPARAEWSSSVEKSMRL